VTPSKTKKKTKNRKTYLWTNPTVRKKREKKVKRGEPPRRVEGVEKGRKRDEKGGKRNTNPPAVKKGPTGNSQHHQQALHQKNLSQRVYPGTGPGTGTHKKVLGAGHLNGFHAREGLRGPCVKNAKVTNPRR